MDVRPIMDGASVYTYWQAALRGDAQGAQRVPTGTGVDDCPQPGLYKTRAARGGSYVPAQVWLTDPTSDDPDAIVHTWRNGLLVRISVDGREVDDVSTYTRHMFFLAVSKADWSHYQSHKVWPGEVSPSKSAGDSGMGHNSPSVRDELIDTVDQAAAWLKSIGGIVSTQTHADSAANWKDRLVGIAGKLDKERDTKIRPHLEAQRDINGEYKPLIDKAKGSADLLRALIGGWIAAEESRIRVERDAARKAAEIKAQADRDAAETARKASEIGAVAMGLPADTFAAAIPIQSVSQETAIDTPIRITVGGQYGKRTAVRRDAVYDVVDWDAVYAAVRDNKGVREAVEKAARAACKAAGSPISGCTVRFVDRGM